MPDDPVQRLTELSVLKPDPRLKPSYRRLTLISHGSHLAALDPADTETLVVSTDWLAWRMWVDRGGHGVHFESVMARWPDDAEPPLELYLRSARWIFDGAGNDLTRFRGVSLGKQFLQDVALFSKAVERLRLALGRLIETYAPGELRLLDIQTENRLLDDPIKRQIVADMAAVHGIRFVDDLAPPDDDDPLWADVRHTGVEPSPTGWRVALRTFYSVAIDMVFRLTTPHLRGRPRIILLTNWNAVARIVAAKSDDRYVLVLIAGFSPKSPRFLWWCWRRGIVLAHLGGGALNAEEVREIEALPARVEAAWADEAASGMEAYRRAFVRGRIFDGHWPALRAPMVKKLDRLWRRHGFRRAVVGDAGNALNRMIAETAQRHGTPVDEIPNGMLLSDQKLDARTGNGAAPPLIDRLLAWGPQNLEWLRATGSPTVAATIGYPALDGVRAEPAGRSSLSPGSRILVLGSWVDGYDVQGLHSTKQSYTVEVVRVLQEAGYRNLRVKIHPGSPLLSYYRAVFRHCGIDCALYKDGPVNPHVAWADAVIGPVSSGSLVETLATGTPYFALRHYPSIMSRRYTDRLQAFDTPRELVDALISGWLPDREAILAYLCAFREFPHASARFWQVIAEAIDATGEAQPQGSPA